jgi:hypothetical protein
VIVFLLGALVGGVGAGAAASAYGRRQYQRQIAEGRRLLTERIRRGEAAARTDAGAEVRRLVQEQMGGALDRAGLTRGRVEQVVSVARRLGVSVP